MGRRAAVALGATLAGLVLAPGAGAAPVPLDQAGSSGFGAGQLSVPQDVVVDATGDIYVADSGNNRIVQFSADGSFVRAFGWGVNTGAPAFEVCTATCLSGSSGGGAGQLFSPSGLALDGAGNLFVVSTNNHRVDQFNLAGPTFVKAFGFDVQTGVGGTFQTCTTGTGCFQGNSGNAAGQLDLPSGIDFASGTVLVTDRNNDRVNVYNPTTPATPATFLTSFGSFGTGNGQMINPNDVTVGGGRIYVSDHNNARISRFAPGAPPIFEHSFGWGVEDGTVAFQVCTAMSTCVPGIPGDGAGQLNFPFGLEVDSSGDLLVAEFSNNRIGEFATAGPSFGSAFGVGVDSGGAAFEVCTTASGCQAGGAGGGSGNIKQPVGVAEDNCGALWVSEQGNNRIERFGEPGTQPTPPCQLAAPTPPSNAFGFGKAKGNSEKGTSSLPVEVPGPGSLALTGKGIKAVNTASLAQTAASTVKLAVKAKGGTAKSLKKKGKVKVTATVTFTPTGGTANALSKKLTLKRKVK